MEISREDVYVAAGMLANNRELISLAHVQSQLAETLAATGSSEAIIAALEELASETPPRLRRSRSHRTLGQSTPSDPVYELVSEDNDYL